MNWQPFNPNMNFFYDTQIFNVYVPQRGSNQLFQIPYEALLQRNQLISSFTIQTRQIQNSFKLNFSDFPRQDVKQELHCKNESLSIEEGLTTPSDSQDSQDSHLNLSPVKSLVPLGFDLRVELEKMLDFITFNMGKNNEEMIENSRNHYLQSPILLQIYDKLFMKYYSSKKCKEDMIRYIFRKVLKNLRTSIMKEQNVSNTKASALLYQKYFQATDEHHQGEDEMEEKDQIYDFFMSSRKISKCKAVNLRFVLKMFSSPKFCQVYEAFLPEFEKVLIMENDFRKEKLIQILVECAEKRCFTKLGKSTRLPWLDVWMNDTKNIAIGLMPNKRLIHVSKKFKC